MIFEFSTSLQFDFITDFSKKYNIPLHESYITIPASMGEGYIRKVEFEKDFRMVVHGYKLKEDLVLKRHPSTAPNDWISIFFYDNKQPFDLKYNDEQAIKLCLKSESAIQVTTNDLSSVIRFPANTRTHYVVVGITTSKLNALLGNGKKNKVLQAITRSGATFLYFESITPEVQQLLRSIVEINMNDDLSNLLIQIKVQELLYHLFHRLSKRENSSQKTVNNADAEKLFLARTLILEDISKPPLIHKLATEIGMSETKLKQLFKQTFGDTIYNYYQKVRMEEAAFLLKQAAYSVSEIGYRMGFSNLSHFSRLFQRYYGMPPKKYTSAG